MDRISIKKHKWISKFIVQPLLILTIALLIITVILLLSLLIMEKSDLLIRSLLLGAGSFIVVFIYVLIMMLTKHRILLLPENIKDNITKKESDTRFRRFTYIFGIFFLCYSSIAGFLFVVIYKNMTGLFLLVMGTAFLLSEIFRKCSEPTSHQQKR